MLIWVGVCEWLLICVGVGGAGWMYVLVDVGVWMDGRYDEVGGYRWVGGCEFL